MDGLRRFVAACGGVANIVGSCSGSTLESSG